MMNKPATLQAQSPVDKGSVPQFKSQQLENLEVVIFPA